MDCGNGQRFTKQCNHLQWIPMFSDCHHLGVVWAYWSLSDLRIWLLRSLQLIWVCRVLRHHFSPDSVGCWRNCSGAPRPRRSSFLPGIEKQNSDELCLSAVGIVWSELPIPDRPAAAHLSSCFLLRRGRKPVNCYLSSTKLKSHWHPAYSFTGEFSHGSA